MKQFQRPSANTSSSALFRQVFNQRFQFMAVLDGDGGVIEVNEAPLRVGLTREQFLGRHIGQSPSFSSDPQWILTWNARLAEAREAGYPISYEDVFLGPHGETRSADAVLTPVFSEDGITIDCFLLEAEDTTERIQVELALRDSERRFHDFAECLPVLAWSTDASGECDYLNGRWLDYTGAAPGQHHGWNWIDAVHPEDRPKLGSAWTAALGGGEPLKGEYRVRQYDGAFRWFDMRVTPVFGDEAQVTRWYGTASDIHDAHELRRSLEERESQLASALKAGAMARYSYDLTTRQFTSDPFLAELIALPSGYRAESGIEGFAEHVHPDDRAEWLRQMREAFDPATPEFSNRYRLLSDGQRSQWVGSRGRVEFDEYGKPRSIAGVVFALPHEDLIDPRD